MKLLFISPFIPYPAEKGGNARTFELLRILCEKHDVHLISFIENEQERVYLSFLEKHCHSIEVIPKKIHLRKYKFLFPLVALASLFSKDPCIRMYLFSK